MSQSLPTNLGPHGEKPAEAPVVVAPGFEIVAQEFWDRNRNFILLLIAVALLAIAGREGWQYFAASREADLQAAYAKAGDLPEGLIAFADAHAGHALAGVAYLRAADDKFVVSDFKSAGTYYAKAAASLSNEELLGRAKLGAAVSQLNGGDQAGGETALKALGADPAAFKGARAEATYHLAALAATAGKADEARKLAEQVSHIDESSPWAQRATVLTASLPAGIAPVETPATGLSFRSGKPPGK